MILLRTMFLILFVAEDPPADEPIVVEDAFGNPRSPSASRPAKKTRTKKPPPTPARCPPGMTYVPGGKFSHKRIPGFCLDTHEVTITSFDAYLQTLARRPDVTRTALAELRSALKRISWPGLDAAPGGHERDSHCTWHQLGKNPDLPINCISHAEAEAYCTRQGKRLPSEREWQWAARGGSRALPYPWGTGRPNRERLNMAEPGGTPRVVPVMAYDASPVGLHDMAGNLWEWAAGDPAATGCNARGGGYRSVDPREVKVTAVLAAATRQDRSDEIGFRCAASVPSAEPSP